MPSIFPTLNLVAHDYLVEANGTSAIATFARASAASRVDAVGVVQAAGNDALRQDCHPITGEHLGWPIEAARTNSRFLDGHLRHLAYFPRRVDDDTLRRVTV